MCARVRTYSSVCFEVEGTGAHLNTFGKKQVERKRLKGQGLNLQHTVSETASREGSRAQ